MAKKTQKQKKLELIGWGLFFAVKLPMQFLIRENEESDNKVYDAGDIMTIRADELEGNLIDDVFGAVMEGQIIPCKERAAAEAEAEKIKERVAELEEQERLKFLPKQSLANEFHGAMSMQAAHIEALRLEIEELKASGGGGGGGGGGVSKAAHAKVVEQAKVLQKQNAALTARVDALEAIVNAEPTEPEETGGDGNPDATGDGGKPNRN